MKSKGFTLIELAVVLAIIAVLAAILTPLVTGYLDQARIARAQADVRTIADAIKLHQRDTGRYPIFATSAQYPATVGGDNTKVVFGGPGDIPTDSASWGNLGTTAAPGTAISTTTLENWINANYSGVSTTNTFPKAAFRGPYVASIQSDPWGQRYILRADDLNSSSSHAFVLSAGPNGAIDTNKGQSATAALVVGSDDIVAVIK